MRTDTKKLRYIAAAFFLINLLWMLYTDVQAVAAYGLGCITVWIVLVRAVYILAIVGMCSSKFKLLLSFSVVEAVLWLMSVPSGIEWFTSCLEYDIPVTASVLYLLRCGLAAISFLLLAAAVLNNRTAKACGITAAVLNTVGAVFYSIVGPVIEPFAYAPLTATSVFQTLLEIILCAVPFVLIGFILDGNAAKKVNSPVRVPESTMAGRIETLSRLKELRDSGVISDTEFEEKKREILEG